MSREDVFDKLETLVLDEENIVTYKILSREFQIHVNVARAFLADFLAVQKTKENVSLKATYFLAGLQEKDGIKSLKVLIASEESLEKAKNSLKEITSCHIYSASKVRANEVALYNTDLSYNHNSQESKDLLVIKHPKIEIKAPTLSKSNQQKNDVKPSLKTQNTSASKNASATIQTNGKNKTTADATNSKAKEVECQKPDKAVTVEEPKKANVETQKPNTLASMWQKNEEKSKAAKSESSKTEGKGKTKSPQESKKAVPKNNIMSMFSKQAEKNAGSSLKKTPVSDPIPEKKADVSFTKPAEKVASTSKVEKKPQKSSDKKRKIPEKKAKSSIKEDTESDTEESKSTKKKRRRIAVFDDSDSDSAVEDMEAEDKAQRSLWLPEDPIEAESPVVPPTPDTDDGEDPIPPTPPVVPHKGRKKISKSVKKTFMDEDGFMVTTEEKEIVSESESDEEPIPTKSSSKGSKEAVKSNNFSYRKQASLTNFFKKS